MKDLMTYKEVMTSANQRMQSNDKTIDQLREDVDEIVIGKESTNERSRKRDMGFVIKGIMNIESAHVNAYQMCQHSLTGEDSLKCMQEIETIHNDAVDKVSEILLIILE